MKILGLLGYLLGLGMIITGIFQYFFRIEDGRLLIAQGIIIMLISFSIRLIAPYLSSSNKSKQEK